MLEQVWIDRFDIVERQIIALKNTLDQAPEFSRQPLLKQVVECFHTFAAAQFKFFYEGFTKDNRLETSEKYSPEYVLTATLEQIGFDLEALQWAADQRRSGTPEMLWGLHAADKLAYQAIKPAVKAFDLDNVSVITYYQKFAEIRMIPYASVALIGIPLTCVPLPANGASPVMRDYLAIPHEVGHYVYWHGKVNGKPLHQHLNDVINGTLPWGKNWIEEVFADVYGGLIAGPVLAKMFQHLQLSYPQHRFVKDDDEHPSPIIRPDIYTKVMRKKVGSEWATYLNGKWINRRDTVDEKESSTGKPKRQFLLAGEDNPRLISEAVSLTDSTDDPLISPWLDKPLDIIITKVLQVLEAIEPFNKNNWWKSYFGHEISDPFALFETHFAKGFDNLEKPGDQIGCNPIAELYEDWKAQGQDLFLANASNFDGLRLEEAQGLLADYATNKQIPALVWLPILMAGGWATKGPEGNPVSGRT